jgi:hypothetical protein
MKKNELKYILIVVEMFNHKLLLESCLCEVESIVGPYYSKECGHKFYHTLIKHSGELTKFVKF